MSLELCQQDAYLRECDATVESIKRVSPKEYHVILSQTVLFPEGGGQPSDTGSISDLKVLRVQREGGGAGGGRAVHVLGEDGAKLAEGQSVKVVLDWEKRYDHMAHHTAQHLISAIAEDMYGWMTACWGLGSKDVTVDLTQDPSKLLPDQLVNLERNINAKIRENRRVLVEVTNRQAAISRPELRASAKSMPEGIEQVRLVGIEGIDLNLCCGTHVNNLSEIQVVKFFGIETQRGNTRLYFRVGDRVLSTLTSTLMLEKSLSSALSCGPTEFVSKVEKIAMDAKQASREVSALKEEMGAMLAKEVLASLDKENKAISAGDTGGGSGVRKNAVAHIHRPTFDAVFFSALAEAVGRDAPNAVLVITGGGGGSTALTNPASSTAAGAGAGAKKGEKATSADTVGSFLLSGPEDKLKELAGNFAKIMKGKGGGRGTRFQGRFESLDNLEAGMEYLRTGVMPA